MGKLRRILSSLTNFVIFWKDKKVPGVADKIRRTQLKQEQKARRIEMDELLKLVREGRLYEADERQLESLRLALELNRVLEEKQVPTPLPTEELVSAVRQAISEGMADVKIAVPGAGFEDPDRPEMRHVSLVDLVQEDDDVDIAHKEAVKRSVEGEESTDKLEKLRKIKGSK
jgi:hypothetical protein